MSKQEEFEKIPEEEILKAAAEIKLAEEKNKEKLISQAYQFLEENLPSEIRKQYKAKNSIKNSLLAVQKWLKENYEFRHNMVSLETEYRKVGEKFWRFFDDPAYRDIDQEVALEVGNIAERHFKNFVYGTKLSKQVDPVREWLFNLPPWDKETDHITHFFQQVLLKDEEQRDFFNECAKKWFVAYVGGLAVDAVVNHTCLVFVSEQGKKKTTFLNSLVPEEMKLEYLYSSTFIAHNKDHEKYLATKMIINLDEMQAFNRSDIESIKSKITQDRVVLRMPYAKADTKAWRRASFVGSVNKVEFLNDATGTRRFLPFAIENIDIDKSRDVKPLYAQALALFKSDFKFYFDLDDIKKLEIHNEPHKDKQFEEEYLLILFRPPTEAERKNGGEYIDYLNASEIMDIMTKKYQKINSNNTVRRNIGLALSANGFKKYSKKRNGISSNLWCVFKIVGDIKEEENGDPLPGTTHMF